MSIGATDRKPYSLRSEPKELRMADVVPADQVQYDDDATIIEHPVNVHQEKHYAGPHDEHSTLAGNKNKEKGENASNEDAQMAETSDKGVNRKENAGNGDHYKTEEGEDCQTLYIRNLPHDFRTEDIKRQFGCFGEIIDCRVVINPVTKDSRGFGFVSFRTVEMAEDAKEKMDGIEIRGMTYYDSSCFHRCCSLFHFFLTETYFSIFVVSV